jgi:hypothetical protein
MLSCSTGTVALELREIFLGLNYVKKLIRRV